LKVGIGWIVKVAPHNLNGRSKKGVVLARFSRNFALLRRDCRIGAVQSRTFWLTTGVGIVKTLETGKRSQLSGAIADNKS
ncbi:MAG: hypothetical protein AB1861_25820, partial [Cyanobacteriota bacterium]